MVKHQDQALLQLKSEFSRTIVFYFFMFLFHILIFRYHTYCVHCSVDQEVSDDLKEKIPLNGGKLMDDPDYAEFVIFGHSGPMHELISFDAVVTDFYIVKIET